ncbi:hypothetical protein EDC01DRAFT_634842 [Geopyxis carbonaria]|nr:hypothetical protein EDC01DRAFT_634842 [Geopyxis carbonaria]
MPGRIARVLGQLLYNKRWDTHRRNSPSSHGYSSFHEIFPDGWLLTPQRRTLYSIGTAIVLFRLYARWKIVGFRGWKPDDFLMILAVIVFGTESTMAFIVGRMGGSNSGMSQEQREALTQQEVHNRTIGSKAFIVGWLMYVTVVWILKACMVFFFQRITMSLKQQGMIRWAFLSVVTSYIGIVLMFLLTCRPYRKLYQVYPDPGKTCWIENPAYYVVVLIFNLATDALIISIPIPLMWRAQIPWRRKWVMLLMFGAGGFVMLAAILRVVFSFTDPHNSLPPAIWACRETFVAVIVGNVPMIKPLFTGARWLSRSTGRSNSKESQSGGTGLELTSKSHTRSKSRAVKQNTFFGGDSTEKIVDEPALCIRTERTYEVSSQEVDLEAGGGGSSGSPTHLGRDQFAPYSQAKIESGGNSGSGAGTGGARRGS